MKTAYPSERDSGEVVSFSIFLPDGGGTLQSSAGSASQFLFSRPRQQAGRRRVKAEKATDG